MKIYTRTGDSGETALFGGERVAKDNVRIEAYGTVDELNSVIGVARAEANNDSCFTSLDRQLGEVQHTLFDLGAELATPEPEKHGVSGVDQSRVDQLERFIDVMDQDLPKLTQFILPGGCKFASQLHLARCVCRRAERNLVTASSHVTIRSVSIVYLNRLSDYLFCAARRANQAVKHQDVPWEKERGTD